MPTQPPSFDIENEYDGPVIGVDEAGRGPLAGPVVAAAVLLDPARLPAGLADSKTLSEKKRDAIALDIKGNAHFGVGIANVEEIDEINILQATLAAMARAVDALLADIKTDPVMVLIDGNKAPVISLPTRTIVKGDAISLSIAAASIIAKTTRDAIMIDLAKTHPEYGWAKNKGYGARVHLDAIETHGPTQHHRKTFAPIRNMLCADSSNSH